MKTQDELHLETAKKIRDAGGDCNGISCDIDYCPKSQNYTDEPCYFNPKESLKFMNTYISKHKTFGYCTKCNNSNDNCKCIGVTMEFKIKADIEKAKKPTYKDNYSGDNMKDGNIPVCKCGGHPMLSCTCDPEETFVIDDVLKDKNTTDEFLPVDFLKDLNGDIYRQKINGNEVSIYKIDKPTVSIKEFLEYNHFKRNPDYIKPEGNECNKLDKLITEFSEKEVEINKDTLVEALLEISKKIKEIKG